MADTTDNPTGGEVANVTNTFSFNLTLTQIIVTMYRKIGAIQEDEEPTPGMFNDAVLALQSIVKELAVTGIHVWAEEEAILFTQPGQRRYLLGPNSTDHCTGADDWVLGTLQTTATTGATQVTLQSTEGLAVGNYFGVVLDSGFTAWSKINALPGAGVVKFDDALPSQASAGEYSFAYETNIIRPLKIPTMRRIMYNGLIVTPLIMLSRQEFMDLPNTINPGLITQGFYAPVLINGTDGAFYAWPVMQDSSCGIRFTWYRPLMDVGKPRNTQDFPQEWGNTLIWLLAKEMAPEYDVPPQKWTMITAMANEKLEFAQNWDRESEDVLFGLDYDQTQR